VLHWLAQGLAALRIPHPGGVVEVVTIRFPSGLNCADITDSLCFIGSLKGWPLCASHTRAVLVEVVTIRFPSGLNWADSTHPLCFIAPVAGSGQE